MLKRDLSYLVVITITFIITAKIQLLLLKTTTFTRGVAKPEILNILTNGSKIYYFFCYVNSLSYELASCFQQNFRIKWIT